MSEEAVTTQTQTSDNAQAEVVQAQPQTQSPPPKGATGGSEGEAQSAVIEAEHAMTTVKAKASALHTLLSNVGHFATLPVTEVEALIAEINYLLGVVRAKL